MKLKLFLKDTLFEDEVNEIIKDERFKAKEIVVEVDSSKVSVEELEYLKGNYDAVVLSY